MKKMNHKFVAFTAAGLMSLSALTACSTNDAEDAASKATSAAADATDDAKDATKDAKDAAKDAADDVDKDTAAGVNARPEECALAEQAGPTADFGPFTGEIHYFQPGQMGESAYPDQMKMLDYADSQMHFELDTKATAFGTNWGYSVDETPANLQMSYKLADKEGNTLAEGMFMEMNAIDGSHYGTNIPKDTIKEPGDYTLTVTIYPPRDYALHADYITGVPAKEWFKPLTAKMDWTLTQENLDIVKKNTVDNPMEPSDKCKDYPVKMYEDADAKKAMTEAEDIEPLPLPNHDHHSH